MLSQLVGGLALVRHAVLFTVVMGAATATVAGAVDVSQSAQARTVAPVATASARPTEQANTKEVEATRETKSERPQSTTSKQEPAKTPKPETTKPETPDTHAIYGLITACVATHERSSEPCAKALELSGLSADEFWAKLGALFSNTSKPNDTPKHTEGLSVVIGACLEKFEAAKHGTYTEPISTSEACRKAFEATGLTPAEFYAKFVAKTNTETPRPTTKPTEKPRTSPKTQTVSDGTLVSMVRDCFTKYMAATTSQGNEELGRAAYEACTKAIAASGLSNDAFWAKFGTPREPKI